MSCVATDLHMLYTTGEQPLASVGSLLQDALALLATVQQPTLDALPKFQVCVHYT